MTELVEKTTILYNTVVRQLVEHKHRMVEIPFTTIVGDTLNMLLVKNILAMPSQHLLEFGHESEVIRSWNKIG